MANLSNINNKFLVTTGGNVGVGVTSPGQKLTVQGSSTAAAGRFTAGGNTNTLELFGSSTTGQSSGLLVNAGTNTADYAARFRNAAGSVIMNIRGDGNVGIGTVSPDAVLHIYGSSTVSEMYLGEDAAVDKAGILKYNQGDGSGTGSVQLGNYGDSLNTAGVTIKKGGNVGIGVVPGPVVAGNIRLDVGTLGCGITSRQNFETVITANADYGTSVTTGKPATRLYLTNGGEFQFETAPANTAGQPLTFTTRMVITSNGSIYNGLASNTHFGLNALSSVTTADESTAFGNNALGSQQTGRNTAVGFHTLQDLTTGQYNTAVGGEAAENIIDGSFNVSVGSFSLRQNTSGSENTAIGYQSLSNNTTQSKLTALGYRAGYFWTAGNENTFIGHQAGFGTSAASTGGENTLVGSLAGASSAGITGSGNTSIGRFTLNALSSGSFNTALGHQSGISITTGNANTLVGKNSGVNIGSASRNSVLGQSAGQELTTGSDNVAIGYEALFNQVSNGQNIAIGVNALYSYTGTRTIAIGYNAGKNFASNVDCVFIGQQAGELRTAGIDNTFVGAYANYNGNSTGCCNTGVGKSTGYELTSGVQNTFLGRQAGYSVTSDNNNTLIGHNTGLFVTGGQNTFIGSGAGDAITTGSHNNIFGYNCEASSVSGTDQIVIGTNGQLGKGNSTGFISPGTGGVFQGNNNTTWSNTSDERIKKNIVDNNKGLEIINKIQIRNFEYRTEDEITDFENPKSAVVNKEGIQLGVIAQEIEKILPETITEESTGVKTLNSDNLTWYLINAVKELKAEIELLKNK